MYFSPFVVTMYTEMSKIYFIISFTLERQFVYDQMR